LNAENENATRQGGALRTNYDAANVTETYAIRQERMNREYIRACKAAGIVPDVSCRASSQNFAGDGSQTASGFESDAVVPCVEHPSRLPEDLPPSDKLDFAQKVSALLEWVDDPKKTVKFQAGMVALGQRADDPKAIAAEFNCSVRLAQLRIAEAKKVLAELRGQTP
jgi:hypothetical protein